MNTSIAVAAAEGLLLSRNRSLLIQFGGSISLNKPWAKSLLIRMGFVKRKATNAGKVSPTELESLKSEFLDRIKSAVTEFGVPPQLVFNVDETAINLVPASNWTMELEGSNRISVVGVDDKREITAVMGASCTGELLPPQLLYTGSTARCHPPFNYQKWDVWHSENHWANESTTLRYIETVLKPTITTIQQELNLLPEQKSVLIWDVFRAHRTPSVLKKLQDENIVCVFVPANCTSDLQPMDLSVNKPLKDVTKKQFSEWYAARFKEQLDRGTEIEQIKIDLKMSTVKPLSCGWFLAAFDHVRSNPSIVTNGFQKAGII